jgi:O-antigen ligase
MCWLIADGAYRELMSNDREWMSWVWAFTFLGAGIWISWVGIFKTAGMQLLWGWLFLVAGIILITLLVGWLLFGWTPVNRMPTRLMLLGAVGMPVTGWLLVLDRDVARYRTQLRKLEDQRCKLRLED